MSCHCKFRHETPDQHSYTYIVAASHIVPHASFSHRFGCPLRIILGIRAQIQRHHGANKIDFVQPIDTVDAHKHPLHKILLTLNILPERARSRSLEVWFSTFQDIEHSRRFRLLRIPVAHFFDLPRRASLRRYVLLSPNTYECTFAYTNLKSSTCRHSECKSPRHTVCRCL